MHHLERRVNFERRAKLAGVVPGRPGCKDDNAGAASRASSCVCDCEQHAAGFALDEPSPSYGGDGARQQPPPQQQAITRAAVVPPPGVGAGGLVPTGGLVSLRAAGLCRELPKSLAKFGPKSLAALGWTEATAAATAKAAKAVKAGGDAFGCLGCGTNCGRFSGCLVHMQQCCPHLIVDPKGLHQRCTYGDELCEVPGAAAVTARPPAPLSPVAAAAGGASRTGGKRPLEGGALAPKNMSKNPTPPPPPAIMMPCPSPEPTKNHSLRTAVVEGTGSVTADSVEELPPEDQGDSKRQKVVVVPNEDEEVGSPSTSPSAVWFC